jgi:hypothetical protein
MAAAIYLPYLILTMKTVGLLNQPGWSDLRKP